MASFAFKGDDPWRWVRRGLALVALVVGWAFIAWQNRFHVTAPLVFICLGYLAVVSTVYFLWRAGSSAATRAVDDAASWARPTGARVELEREKRTLLKAIKEAEFDLEMGKLSKVDAYEMIASYRAQAIAVIREIDRLDGSALGTTRMDGDDRESVRAQIERELKARLAAAPPSKKRKGKGKKPESKPSSSASEPIYVSPNRASEAPHSESESVSESDSVADSESGSVSDSGSESVSESESESGSVSESVSASESESETASLSPTPSPVAPESSAKEAAP